MGFGCTIPNTGVPSFTPQEMRTMAMRAEELGFESVWVSDHVVVPSQIEPRYPYSPSGIPPFGADQAWSEPLTVLANLAGCTHRVKLATGVLIVPYREPVVLAKTVSTLDYFSGGRVILGIGVGWMEEEFVALGLDTYHERGKVTDEYIRIFKELWTNDDPEFQGSYARFSGIKFYPKPVQKPHPPIWVGGTTRAALRRTARMGDGWIPAGSISPSEMGQMVGQIRDMTERAGRPREAVAIAHSAPVDFSPASDGPRQTMAGTAQEIASDITAYQRAGVRHFRCNFQGDTLNEKLENMERFAGEVMPQVA